MKKKGLTLCMALLLSAAALGGCGQTGETPHDPVVTVQDGYVYVDGKKTDIEVNEAHEPAVSVGEDGYVYVDGKKTDIKVNEAPEKKTAFELWKEEHPGYTGTEEEWQTYLDGLTAPKEEERVEYKIIENGKFRGAVVSGSATRTNSSLKLNNAVLKMSESVVLPLTEGAKWEADITGTLLSGSGTGAQFFAGEPFSEFGRVYIGVNKSSKMLYIGVRLNTVYVNYGWKFDDAAFFNSKHNYKFGYENGVYTLSVDGGAKQIMTDINFNQQNGQWLDDPETDGETLNGLIRTVLAQDYIEMTALGTDGFAWNADIENFTVTTSAADGYKRLLSHPLANTKIFYLGSSITYGAASGGVAFGEIIHAITGNPFQKEAVSGTTLVDNGSESYVQRLKKLDFSQKPDYLVVQLSTNDFSQNKPLGSVQSGTSSGDFDTQTVSGAIQHIIAYAKEQCPTVKVVFYAGAVKESWGYRSAYENYLNGDFKAICEKWDIEPLDIFHAQYKSYSFFWNDEIHPKIEGYAFGWTPLFVRYFTDRL